MKRLICAAPIMLAVCASIAESSPEGIPITREEAASMKSVDIDKLGEQLPSYEGKIVKLRFNHRAAEISKKDDGTITGSIYFFRSAYDTRNANRETKFGEVYAVVPSAGADWFMKIPTSMGSRTTLYAIARISKTQYGATQAELLGREIKTDLKGSRVIW
jgi:hypothetical protein